MCSDFCERRKAAFIALDCDYALGTIGKQGAGKAARSRSHLNYGALCQVAGRPRNLVRDVEIEQKVLTERFLGPQFEAIHDILERRQSIVTHIRAAFLSAM